MEETEPSVELIFNEKKKAERHNATKPLVELRNFVNHMNDYMVPHRGSEEAIARSQQVPLTKDTAPRVALWVPREFLEHSFPNSNAFLKAAIKLKEEVPLPKLSCIALRSSNRAMDAPVKMVMLVCGSSRWCKQRGSGTRR